MCPTVAARVARVESEVRFRSLPELGTEMMAAGRKRREWRRESESERNAQAAARVGRR